MTLRHFEIFKAVAETGNFTRAAEKLYITQSAVSRAVRELEEQTGMPLFDRLSKSIHITRAGELLLDEVIPILSAYDILKDHISDLEKSAPIHIVSSITIANFYLPGLIKKFNTIYPGASANVEVVSASAAVEKLRTGKADIALVEGTEPQGNFCSNVFSSYYLKAVCSPDYGLPGKRLSVEEFCGEKLLLREKGSATRDTMDSEIYLLGYTVKPAWCSVNSSALIAAAKHGLGIAVLPEELIRDDLENGSLMEVFISDLVLKNNMLAVWHKDKYMNSKLKAFLNLVRKNGMIS